MDRQYIVTMIFAKLANGAGNLHLKAGWMQPDGELLEDPDPNRILAALTIALNKIAIPQADPMHGDQPKIAVVPGLNFVREPGRS